MAVMTSDCCRLFRYNSTILFRTIVITYLIMLNSYWVAHISSCPFLWQWGQSSLISFHYTSLSLVRSWRADECSEHGCSWLIVSSGSAAVANWRFTQSWVVCSSSVSRRKSCTRNVFSLACGKNRFKKCPEPMLRQRTN